MTDRERTDRADSPESDDASTTTVGEDTGGDEKRSTFVVSAADDASAVLEDVHDGQVHTLGANPGVEVGEAIEGVVAPEPPMGVTWRLVDVERRWTVTVEESDQSPTAMAREVAADQSVGDLTRRERAGRGELHVVSVPEGETDAAVADVLADEATTRSRAARLGVGRVEVRSEPGLVVVRYLP